MDIKRWNTRLNAQDLRIFTAIAYNTHNNSNWFKAIKKKKRKR
jgi:hypothetical protein